MDHEDQIFTEFVAYSSDDERNFGEVTACKQLFRLVDDHTAVHIRPKLRVDRVIKRKLQMHKNGNSLCYTFVTHPHSVSCPNDFCLIFFGLQ